MNHLALWMMRLYPSRWRKRYGEEVCALIGDAGADFRTVADLLKGALSMQLSSWSFPRLAAILGILGMLAGLGASLLAPTQYVARAELEFAGDTVPVSAIEFLQMQLLSRVQLSAVINAPNLRLYSDLQQKTPLQDVIQEMRRSTVIELDGPDKIAIQFTYPDKAKAALAVRQMATDGVKVLEKMAEASQHIGPRRARLLVADTASLPTRPLRPAWWQTALAGLTLGLLIAFLFAATRRPGVFKRSALRFALAGSLAGAALSWMIPHAPWLDARGIIPLSWESHATLYDEGKSVPLPGLLVQAASRTSMAAIASDPSWNLYHDTLKTQSLDDVAETMRRDMVIATRQREKGLRFIDLSFTCPDRFQCQRILSVIVSRLLQGYSALAAQTAILAQPEPGGQAVRAGSVLSVERAEANRRKPVLIGLLAGLLLALLISILRFRWRADEEDSSPAFQAQTPGVYGRRFRRLGAGLATLGMAAGMVVALSTSPRYTSTALVSFEGASSQNYTNLLNDTIRRSRNYPVWRQVEAGGTKTDAFALRLVAGDPRRARAALQELVGEIDRTLLARRGTQETQYEKIRGVDGALLPITATEGLAIAETRSVTTEEIPYDDERARPRPEPAWRSIKMNVIDTPSLPSHAEGWGRWVVAIGITAGLALAAILSLFGGFGNGLPATQTNAVVDPSLS